MLHVNDLRPNMPVVGSDGEQIGVYRSLSGQLLCIADGALPDDRHFLDLGLVGDVKAGRIELLIPSGEARERWSEES